MQPYIFDKIPSNPLLPPARNRVSNGVWEFSSYGHWHDDGWWYNYFLRPQNDMPQNDILNALVEDVEFQYWFVA